MPWDNYLSNLHVGPSPDLQPLFAGGQGWGNSGGMDFASIDNRPSTFTNPMAAMEQNRRNQLLAQLMQGGGGAPIGYQQPGMMTGGLQGAVPRASAAGAPPMDSLDGQKLPFDPRVQAYLPQMMAAMNGTSGGHGYAKIYGSGDLPPYPLKPGQGRPLSMALPHLENGTFGTVPDPNAASQMLTSEQRMAAAQAFAARTNLPGLQQEQLIKHATGKTPDEYMKFAVEMRQKEAELRKSQLDEYGTLSKSADADPEDILATYGKNPALPSAFYRRGKTLAPDQFGVAREIPGAWSDIGGATVQQLQKLRAGLGMNDEAATASLKARMEELLAKANDPGTDEEWFNQFGAPAMPRAETQGPSVPAGIAMRQAIARTAGPAFLGTSAHAINSVNAAGNAVRSAPSSALNFLYQLFGGNSAPVPYPAAQAPVTPYITR